MKWLRRLLIPLSLLAIFLLFRRLPGVLQTADPIPGLTGPDRTLLRIWIAGSPGGGQAWLTSRLRAWEKANPGVRTYLRIVEPAEALSPDAVLPDVLLYLPGDFDSPDALFTPLAQDAALLREALLRCGRWRSLQYALPLCWAGWVLAIDSALEPGTARTPAPTTLLGRPAADPQATPVPGYPLQAAGASACPLQSAGGAALFSLQLLLPPEGRPPLPDSIGQLSPKDVYSAFQRRECATAMLTTGQATAFTALVANGSGFPFRIMTPPEIVTDQVWLASLTPDAPPEAAALLAFLTARDAQTELAAQGLHTVRSDLTLYAAGFSADVEAAAATGLTAINAYADPAEVQSAAWQSLQGTRPFAEALLPLL